MKTKIKQMGLTVVEMLIVLVVMAVLISLLLPATNKIIEIAKTAKQKAQFTTLEIALESFKNDMGYYPPSDNDDNNYCGAQKLAEAMVGWDLFGFHPKSEFISDNGTTAGGVYYDGSTDTERDKNLRQRKGLYVDLEKANPVLLNDLYNNNPPTNLEGNTYVLTDTFKRLNGKFQNALISQSIETDGKIGMPILYYKARSNRVEHLSGSSNNIFEYEDNELIVLAEAPWWNKTPTHDKLTEAEFYDQNDYITNMKITAQVLPYNKDSFILISAGADGLYGTKDDVFNFEKE